MRNVYKQFRGGGGGALKAQRQLYVKGIYLMHTSFISPPYIVANVCLPSRWMVHELSPEFVANWVGNVSGKEVENESGGYGVHNIVTPLRVQVNSRKPRKSLVLHVYYIFV